MPYRAEEYVPGIYQPNDSRLSDLLFAQSQIQQNRISNQGLATAAMYRSIGNAAGGALGDLAQYKREEPARKEAERVRKEKEKLRGLEQMGGAAMASGQMDQAGYGKLLQQEGFAEKGQELLDKDMARKATEATYMDAQRKREHEEMSEVTFALDRVRESDNPAEAYDTVAKMLREKHGDKVRNLPPAYDKAALDKYVQDIETQKDVNDRNARAEHATKVFNDKNATHEAQVSGANSMFAALAKKANTPVEWDRMWANFDARTQGLSAEQKARIEAEIPYPRQFSPEAHQQAVDLEDQKDPTTPLGAAYQMFQDRHQGQRPVTPADQAEIRRIIADFTQAAHVPTAGSTVDSRQQATWKHAANTQKNNELFKLESKFRAGDISEAELAEGKEDVQRMYLSQINAEDGPSLAQIESQRGRDIMGRPLSAQAQPGAARPGAPAVPGAPAGQTVVMVSPDGKTTMPVDAKLVSHYEAMGAHVVPGAQPPAAPAAPAPQNPDTAWRRDPRQFPLAAQAPPPGALRGEEAGPPTPELPEQVMMQNRRSGRIERVPGSKIDEYVNNGWIVLPPTRNAGAAYAEKIGGQIYRDMTTGAPPRQAATPRR